MAAALPGAAGFVAGVDVRVVAGLPVVAAGLTVVAGLIVADAGLLVAAAGLVVAGLAADADAAARGDVAGFAEVVPLAAAGLAGTAWADVAALGPEAGVPAALFPAVDGCAVVRGFAVVAGLVIVAGLAVVGGLAPVAALGVAIAAVAAALGGAAGFGVEGRRLGVADPAFRAGFAAAVAVLVVAVELEAVFGARTGVTA